jgi:hypothetical protein
MSRTTTLTTTVVAALLVGVAVGALPGRWDVVIGLGGVVLIVAVTGSLMRGPAPRRAPRPRLSTHQLMAIVSLYLLVLSTLTFRVRGTDALEADPLDLAGSFRIGCLGGAVALACASMLLHRISVRDVPPSVWAYVAYVGVVPLGAANAVSAGLVMFKWAELVAFLIVWFAITNAFRGDPTVAIRHLGIILGMLVASVLFGVLTNPNEALEPSASVLPVQLQGLNPVISKNDVGLLGLIVILYGLGRTRISPGLIAGGGALIVAAQYRTGYVCALAMVVVFLVMRRQAAARIVLAGMVLLLPLAATSGPAQELWLRGENPELVSSLTGRTGWWAAAIEATERSPLTGLGLTSGVRYEIFRGSDAASVSTLHSTWIEAYTGVGLIGAALLAVALALASFSSWRRARWDGYLFPVLAMTLLVVRSLTSTTIELGGLQLMLFLLVASASRLRPARPRDLALVPTHEHADAAPVPTPS